MTVRAARTALVFRPGIRARSSLDSVCWLPFGVEAGCTRVPLACARTWPAAGRLFPLPARIRCTAGVSKERVRSLYVSELLFFFRGAPSPASGPCVGQLRPAPGYDRKSSILHALRFVEKCRSTTWEFLRRLRQNVRVLYLENTQV